MLSNTLSKSFFDLVAQACATKSKKDLDKVFESIKLIRR